METQEQEKRVQKSLRNDPNDPEFLVVTETLGLMDVDTLSDLEGTKRFIEDQLLFLGEGDKMYVCEIVDIIEIEHHDPRKFEHDPCPGCTGKLEFDNSEEGYFCEVCNRWFSATELSSIYDS